MRFHVVGVGAIGSLVSFHLKRLNRRLVQDLQVLQGLPHPHSIPFLPAPYNHGVILHLRQQRTADKIREKAHGGIIVERGGVKEREKGFGVKTVDNYKDTYLANHPLTASSSSSSTLTDDLLPGSSRLEELGYPTGSIDSLIMTTKAHITPSALRPLLPFITPATTIVLLQNGQGVIDVLLEKYFPDPEKRPHFILGNTTHGAWIKGKMHCVHASVGRLELAIVPNRTLGKDYERLVPFSHAGASTKDVQTLRRNGIGSEEGEREGYEDGEEDREVEGQREERRDMNGFESFLPRNQRPGFSQGDDHIPAPRPPAMLDINAIPNVPSTQTLLHTMSILLNLPLEVTWHPIDRYQMIALKKLVVNACINPVTALVECRNGDLFGNRFAESTIRDICREISQILEALAERSRTRRREREEAKRQQATLAITNADGHNDDSVDDVIENGHEAGDEDDPLGKSDFILSPSGYDLDSTASPLDASLRTGALYQEVQRVIQLTSYNYSSMLQDIRKVREGSRSTEINYINGYFSRLGRSLGIQTPVNDLMTQLVTLKSNRSTR